MSQAPIRVVIAKPGLDGHDRGAKVVARALRDAGMEVIYTGLRQTPQQIVAAVVQEDARVLGMSILSGAHNQIFPEVLRHGAGPVQTFLFGHVIVDAEVLRMMLYGLAMVLIMLYRPKGLWPAPEHGVNPSNRRDAGKTQAA